MKVPQPMYSSTAASSGRIQRRWCEFRRWGLFLVLFWTWLKEDLSDTEMVKLLEYELPTEALDYWAAAVLFSLGSYRLGDIGKKVPAYKPALFYKFIYKSRHFFVLFWTHNRRNYEQR